jgi:hypothetical protein
MNDVVAAKRCALKPKLIAVAMFLKLNMSLVPNNPVVESSIWNTLIPPHPELPDDIDNLIIMKKMMIMMMMMIYHQYWSKVKNRLYMLILSLSISLCNNMKIQSRPKEI